MRASGTEGYAETADALVKQYESIGFADVHGDMLHLLPSTPCRALDIGAGTGRDAAALAERGHQVTAVEPTAELRTHGQRLHRDAAIEWIDDSLPDLARIAPKGERFDLILLSAVWMHLDVEQRRRAMRRVGELVVPGGVVLLSLRHGPVPEGRRMFEVSGEETTTLAAEFGLRLQHRVERPAVLRQPGVTWTHLAFLRPR